MYKHLSATLLILICSVSLSLAQKVKIKKDVVYVDGKECLKTSNDPNNVSFFDLEGNEIFFIKFIHNSRFAPLYCKITFFESNLSFTSASFMFTKKILVNKLISDGTLKDCKLVPEKVQRFVQKYDENVERDPNR